MKKTLQTNRPVKRRGVRKGAAVAEFALLSPVLALLALGAIDAGQLVNVSQVINDASREGARLAVRSDTTDAAAVKAAVDSYVNEALPGEVTVTVEIGDSYGVGIPGDDLSGVDSGTPITVRVALQYDTVRWLRYLPFLDAMSVETETVMRRE